MNKKLYSVRRVDVQLYEDGRRSVRSCIIGTTQAVSAAQAINNVKHRLSIKPSDLFCDGLNGYSRDTYFEAKELNY